MKILEVNTLIPTRLDRYLKRLFPQLTQGALQQALRKKQIKVNNKKAEADLRITEGDKITVIESLANLSAPQEERIVSKAAMRLAENILGQYLLYNHPEFIAINKPAGLATQGGSKVSLSIDDAIFYLNQQGEDFKLVHRLDKDTSGVLLIAKNHGASVKLAACFKEQRIHKTYLAITQGWPEKDKGEVTSLLGKSRGGVYEKVEENAKDAKLATTCYKVLKKFDGKALIEFKPLTGRMHQLRVHAQKLGCPILGDTKYGVISSLRVPQMRLHAARIILPEEVFGVEIVIEAKLPQYFNI